MESPREAFVISIGRGALVIVPTVIILSSFFQMTGVWLSFVMTEMVVLVAAMGIVRKKRIQYKSRVESGV